MGYYNCGEALSVLDANGERPEIIICVSNRTAGKTFAWNRYFLKRFITNGEKFMLIYRFKNELQNIAEKFYKNISIKFPGYDMLDETMENGAYQNLYVAKVTEGGEVLEKKHCGYAVCLNCCEFVKKNSHVFDDTERMLFDEFQPENSRYLPDEVGKLMSIHISVARGIGKRIRFVQTILVGNPVTMLNPYYLELGIADRLTEGTRFLRGDGWILEQGHNTEARRDLEESAFIRAFSKNEQAAYAAQGVYLNDSKVMVERLSGRLVYLATVKFSGECYGVKLHESGLLYFTGSIDPSCRQKIALSVSDLSGEWVLGNFNSPFFRLLKTKFENGMVRFENLKCKSVCFNALKYTI